MTVYTTALQPVKKKAARNASRTPIGKSADRTLHDTEAHKVLMKLKTELDYLHNSFDTVTDPILIDSFIYEIMSVNMKYQYYLRLCKASDSKHTDSKYTGG